MGLRRPHPDVARHARGQLVERGDLDEPSPVDDHDLVDRLRDLGQHVARDEHGLARGGEPAHERSQPVDALGVEAVGRLVEDQELGVAQQGGGEPEPLPHAERVAADAAAAGARELDQLEHLVHARRPAALRRARA